MNEPGARTVLVAEDDERLRKLHEQSLKRAGFRILLASNGHQALSMARRERPDAILLDVRMPVLSGYEVARLLKFDDRYRSIPILMLSAQGATADEKLGYETGADRYLIKPMPYEKLVSEIHSVLGEDR
ncbi:MAG: response regulator [Planctomycetes bacterium]|nr:response regulator [Planctomycetota bacterium]